MPSAYRPPAAMSLRVHTMKKVILILVIALCSCSKKPETLKIGVFNDEVDLSKAVSGEWDTACILTPYTSVETGAQLTGLSQEEIANTGIEVSDSFNTIVFLHQGEKFVIYNVSRIKVKFPVTKATCFAKNEAKFKIV